MRLGGYESCSLRLLEFIRSPCRSRDVFVSVYPRLRTHAVPDHTHAHHHLLSVVNIVNMHDANRNRTILAALSRWRKPREGTAVPDLGGVGRRPAPGCRGLANLVRQNCMSYFRERRITPNILMVDLMREITEWNGYDPRPMDDWWRKPRRDGVELC